MARGQNPRGSMSNASVYATRMGVTSEADTGRAQAPLVPVIPMHTGWQTPLAPALPLPSASDVENNSDNWLSQQQQQQQQHQEGISHQTKTRLVRSHHLPPIRLQ